MRLVLLFAAMTLSACYSPDYLLVPDIMKNNGQYTCERRESPTNQNRYNKRYPDSKFNDNEAEAKSACQTDLAKTKNKYRCEDYVDRDFRGPSKYSGLRWGARMYDKCIADGRGNCYDNSYSFTDCIAAKCSYKAKSLTFVDGRFTEDWITSADWNDCINR